MVQDNEQVTVHNKTNFNYFTDQQLERQPKIVSQAIFGTDPSSTQTSSHRVMSQNTSSYPNESLQLPHIYTYINSSVLRMLNVHVATSLTFKLGLCKYQYFRSNQACMQRIQLFAGCSQQPQPELCNELELKMVTCAMDGQGMFISG